MPKKKKPVVTIGVDSSTTNCGVAVFKNGKLKKTYNHTFSGTYDLGKLDKIIATFNKVFSKYKPDIVILERPAPVRNSKTLTALNQVAGAIWATAVAHGAFIDDIHNKSIKKIMGIKSKEEAIKKVKKDFGVTVETDHEADAILTVEAYKIFVENGGSS